MDIWDEDDEDGDSEGVVFAALAGGVIWFAVVYLLVHIVAAALG